MDTATGITTVRDGVKPEVVYKKLGHDLESSDNATRKNSSEELSYCLFMAILVSAS
jgi:hypothetical protein